ncbi:MAG: hypothetical protein JHD15_07175 [Phenylobacterium sp.]|uniref:hypothetical protein n=1 Tax=Phenylobacterium sp. TaxID=1871053 RepID=UPI001A3280DE|nr:hypothetical protein [Phenylobacterium sp.]MBJ7410135.1 hypothetical protein [Phenylobacterium sp.]
MPEENPIASIAARGLADPSTLTPDEIQSLCGWILPQAETPPPPVLSDAVRAELGARRDAFMAKADKRRREAGFAANVAELDAWVAEIDAELR